MTHHRPLIAILRGLTPAEATGALDTLIAAGITWIEVPLNSPDPFDSIAAMVARAGPEVVVGAGTVLDPEEVARLSEIGARLIVSPDSNPEVIRAAKSKGLLSFPGVFTATEAFAALRAGADGLKLFPASKLGLDGYAALKAVLPPDVPCYAVGGVGPAEMAAWRAAGITGFGLGSALYRPGLAPRDLATRARAIVQAYDEALP